MGNKTSFIYSNVGCVDLLKARIRLNPINSFPRHSLGDNAQRMPKKVVDLRPFFSLQPRSWNRHV